ncbi:MAG TPA: hypothetical protein PK867_22510 [Pirellulales bacterium]|nr:hypothetical protein [Pirellulales bacterium]
MKLCSALATEYHRDQMLSSQEEAIAYLNDPSGDRRLAALMILWRYWRRDDVEFQHICERVALHDPEVRVRGPALFALASSLSGTSDPRVGNLLANVVRDVALPVSLRKFAYSGLFRLRGLRENDRLTSVGRFPGEVDWKLVDGFRTGPLQDDLKMTKFTEPETSGKGLRHARHRPPSKVTMSMWRTIAGQQLDVMLSSEREAAAFLNHPSWKLRLAALSVLRNFWHRTDIDFLGVCQAMALDDPHPQVRGVARSYLPPDGGKTRGEDR